MSKQTATTLPKLRFPEFENAGEWEVRKLGHCLDYLQPTPYLVNNTTYDDEYQTPVLTAGKTFILGYTNETHGIFDKKLPVIIFDDFTTASKYVDFPFKAKSSAMKILLVKNKFNIKFCYEALQKIRYEVGNHQRHWIAIFSKLKIPVPNIKEQQKIADCLSSLDDLISTQTQKLTALQQHKKGLMQNLFPADGKTIPKLRFSGFQNAGEWKNKKLSDLGSTFGGLTGKTKVDFGQGKRYIQYMQVFNSSKIDIKNCKLVNIKKMKIKTKFNMEIYFLQHHQKHQMKWGFHLYC